MGMGRGKPVGAGGSTPANMVEATTADLTYYVRTTGSDNNTGLATDAALLTIQKAIDLIPTIVEHEILIDIGEGTFDGFALTGRFLKFEGKITVRGTLGQPTLGGGTATGTADGGVKNTLEDSGQAWIVNGLRGYLVLIDGEYRVVRNNTATAMELVGDYAANASGKAYEILEQKTVLDTPSPSGVGYGSVEIRYCCGGRQIYLQDIHGINSYLGVYVTYTTGVYMIRCKVSANTYGIYTSWSTPFGMSLEDCYVTDSTDTGFIAQGNTISVFNRVFAYNCGVGIAVYSNTRTELDKVYADNNTNHGIYITSSLNVDFSTAYASGNGKNGLCVVDMLSFIDLDGGVFSNNGIHGISVGVEPGNRVKGSKLNAMGTIECSNNTLSGVAIGWGSQAAFTALTGSGNGEFGLAFTEDALNASVQITSATTITGTSGDAAVDGATPLTWAGDFAANKAIERNANTGAVMMRYD